MSSTLSSAPEPLRLNGEGDGPKKPEESEEAEAVIPLIFPSPAITMKPSPEVPGKNKKNAPPATVTTSIPPAGAANGSLSRNPGQASPRTGPHSSPETTVITYRPVTVVSDRTGSFHQFRAHVLIDRDYSQRFTVRFTTDFPSALEGRIDPASFNFTVSQINSLFQNAEKNNWKTFCQSILGYMTFSFIYYCWKSKYEQCLSEVTAFVERENAQVYLPRGLQIVDPSIKALRNLEILILSEGTGNED